MVIDSPGAVRQASTDDSPDFPLAVQRVLATCHEGVLAKNPIEDWLQTVAVGVLAAILPLAAGWIVRLAGPRVVRAFSADGAPEKFEAVAYSIAPWVVLICAPIIVFLFARWAVQLTRGSTLIRATLVGLIPGALHVWALWERYSAIWLTGRAPFKEWTIIVWVLLNLGCGALAGVMTQARHGRRAAQLTGRGDR